MLLGRYLIPIVGLLLMAPLAQAETPSEPTADELDSLFAIRAIHYEQEDDASGSHANPYIDEDASIQEGVLLLRGRINDTNAIEGKFTGVVVTAASWDDARLKAETISGATTEDHGRLNWNIGWLYKNSQGLSGSIHAIYGSEYTYRTEGLSAALGQIFNEGSTALGLKVTAFNDRIRNIRFNGQEFNQEARDTYTVDASLVQSINPRSHINIGLSHTEQEGFLETSYNAVLVADVFDYERAPDTRTRDALSFRYKQALKRDSYQLGYSYYQDSWGINANVAEARYYFNLYSGRLQVQTSTRYYDQSAADFYAVDLDLPQRYQTSDSDLADFTGRSVGVLLALSGPRGFLRYRPTYEIGFNYYQRSDNLDLYWLTLGWSFRI